MRDVMVAFGRALASLGQRGILWHLVWPSLVAMVLWIAIAIASWTTLVEGAMAWIEGWQFASEWLTASEFGAATVLILVKFALAFAVLPMIYVTAAVLVAVIALPMMLERVARRTYGDIEERRGGSNTGSALNAIAAGVLFVMGLVVSLPFWLIPGVGLVVTVALTAWLNQRAFGYDALMFHADREELPRMRREQRGPMLLLGTGCALLAYIPLVNLLAPAFSGLAFVHFMLEALRRERAGQGEAVFDAVTGRPYREVR